MPQRRLLGIAYLDPFMPMADCRAMIRSNWAAARSNHEVVEQFRRDELVFKVPDAGLGGRQNVHQILPKPPFAL